MPPDPPRRLVFRTALVCFAHHLCLITMQFQKWPTKFCFDWSFHPSNNFSLYCCKEFAEKFLIFVWQSKFKAESGSTGISRQSTKKNVWIPLLVKSVYLSISDADLEKKLLRRHIQILGIVLWINYWERDICVTQSCLKATMHLVI